MRWGRLSINMPLLTELFSVGGVRPQKEPFRTDKAELFLRSDPTHDPTHMTPPIGALRPGGVGGAGLPLKKPHHSGAKPPLHCPVEQGRYRSALDEKAQFS